MRFFLFTVRRTCGFVKKSRYGGGELEFQPALLSEDLEKSAGWWGEYPVINLPPGNIPQGSVHNTF